MFYHTEAKPQCWRAVAVFDDRNDQLLFLNRSSTQVRAGLRTAQGSAGRRAGPAGARATSSPSRAWAIGS